MFSEGMILRCFMNVTENSIEIFHVFKNKDFVNKKDRRGLVNFGKTFERWVEQSQV
jgi:hypothetical protein